MKFRLAGPKGTVIIVEAKVNGKGPFSFAVDTGASVTVISEQTAKKIGVSENSSTLKKGHGCCGEMDMSLLRVESVQVGDVEVNDIQVALMDLSTISKAVGTDLDGIIGHNFMKNYRVIIDYPQQEISFEKA